MALADRDQEIQQIRGAFDTARGERSRWTDDRRRRFDDRAAALSRLGTELSEAVRTATEQLAVAERLLEDDRGRPG